jgi:hypothetical protein
MVGTPGTCRECGSFRFAPIHGRVDQVYCQECNAKYRKITQWRKEGSWVPETDRDE